MARLAALVDLVDLLNYPMTSPPAHTTAVLTTAVASTATSLTAARDRRLQAAAPTVTAAKTVFACSVCRRIIKGGCLHNLEVHEMACKRHKENTAGLAFGCAFRPRRFRRHHAKTVHELACQKHEIVCYRLLWLLVVV